MNIVLPARWKRFVRARLESGRYGSEAELMSAALQLLEERDTQVESLKKEIEVGRRSGKPRAFDPEGVKKRGRIRLAERTR